MNVVGSGSGEAGSSYTLTCTVTLGQITSDGSVSIQWQGPRPHTITTTMYTDTRIDKRVSSRLPLDPLTLADGGDYTCTATYTVNDKTTSGSGSTTLVVISKFTVLVILNLRCNSATAVPPPPVTITLVGTVNNRVLVGVEVVLYCDIELSGVMRGSDVTVDVTWFRDSAPFSGAVTSDDGDTVQGTVTFSPVSVSDNATYVCQATITPLNEGLSKPVNASSDPFLLAVSGMIMNHLPFFTFVRGCVSCIYCLLYRDNILA